MNRIAHGITSEAESERNRSWVRKPSCCSCGEFSFLPDLNGHAGMVRCLRPNPVDSPISSLFPFFRVAEDGDRLAPRSQSWRGAVESARIDPSLLLFFMMSFVFVHLLIVLFHYLYLRRLGASALHGCSKFCSVYKIRIHSCFLFSKKRMAYEFMSTRERILNRFYNEIPGF